ncbi:P-type conjugative transfer ATPase TrbB, partial [Mesorhizobium sp. M7A.F.Ca.US.003.02.2.1]
RGSARRLSELARVDGLRPDGDYRVAPAVLDGDDSPTLLIQSPEGENP